CVCDSVCLSPRRWWWVRGTTPAGACVRLNPPDPRSFHCETVAPPETPSAASQPATIFVAAMTSGTLAGTMTSGEVGLNEPQQSQLISYSNQKLSFDPCIGHSVIRYNQRFGACRNAQRVGYGIASTNVQHSRKTAA